LGEVNVKTLKVSLELFGGEEDGLSDYKDESNAYDRHDE
jgi:hypothetical protein